MSERPDVDVVLNAFDRGEKSVAPCPEPPSQSTPVKGNASSSAPNITIDMSHGENQAGSRLQQGCKTWPEMPARDRKKDDDACLFGVPQYQPHYVGGAAGDRSYNYEEKYPADEPYHEVGDNARLWKVYLDEAEIYDDDMVRGFRDTIDSLLVFAALFSAVVTTFVVQTSQVLQPDYALYSSQLLYEQIQLLRANGNVTAIGAVPSNPSSPEPSYTTSDIWVNGLFFTSLALSLSTALLSVLVKQWIQAYTGVTSGTAKSRALVRQFRFTGLTKWKLPETIGILPLLLHASLAVFLIGLAVFVQSLHSSLSSALIAITGFTFLFYLVSLFLPAIWIDCPYRIPVLFSLTRAFLWANRCAMHLIVKTVGGIEVRRRSLPQFRPRYQFPWFSNQSLKLAETGAIQDSKDGDDQSREHDQAILDSLVWLHGLSSNPTVIRAAARGVAGLPMNFRFKSEILDSRMPYTISDQLLISAKGNLSKGDELFNGDWIRASLNTIFDDSMCLNESTLTHLRESLCVAAEAGNVEFVKHYIHLWSYIIVNEDYRFLTGVPFTWHKMALDHKCNWPSLDILKLKVESNLWTRDLSEKLEDDANQALLAALSKGKSDVVKLLLEKGADLDVNGKLKGDRSESYLHAASRRGHLDVVRLLLEQGADFNIQGGQYGTAIQAASISGHLDIVKALLDKGSNTSTQGVHYENALQSASFKGHLDIVKLLLEKGVNSNAQGGDYGKVLQSASYCGRLDVVKILLEKGVDVNAQGGPYVGSALHVASLEGHLDVVKLLLEKGADPNVQGGLYGNALQAGSLEGHLDVVRLLLDKGASINSQGGLYGNALIAASSRPNPDVVGLLIQSGADVNMKPTSKTPLQAAIKAKQQFEWRNYPELGEKLDKVVSILRANGATDGD